MKVWSGSAWAEKPTKVWSGSAWVAKPVKVWTGSAWVVKPAAGGPSAPYNSILTAHTPGTDRNDFSGEVGVRLGIGTVAIPITFLGARRHHVNQTGVHTLKLYEWFSGLVERTATIDYTGIPVGGYAWGSITPHTLGANGYYALLMVVTAYDGQTWANPGAVSYKNPAIVNVYDSYYAGGLATGGINTCFIGMDIGSTVANVYGDNFERPNANLEASSPAGWSWTHDGLVAGALTLVGGKLNCNTTNTTGSAYKTPSVGSADHSIEFQFAGATTDNTGCFACCRLADRNNFVGVRCGSDGAGSNGRIEVYRRVAGTLTALRTAAGGEVVSGDIIKLSCTGTNWAVLKNGVSFASGAIGASLTDQGTGFVARSVSGMSIAHYVTVS